MKFLGVMVSAVVSAAAVVFVTVVGGAAAFVSFFTTWELVFGLKI